MNNRKQQINSLLSSLTSKELEEYLKENNINKDKLHQLETMKIYYEHKNRNTHMQKLLSEMNNSGNMYLLGEANIIAYIIYYGLHKEFKVKDFVQGFDNMLKSDNKLKEYVYEIMKDFK